MCARNLFEAYGCTAVACAGSPTNKLNDLLEEFANGMLPKAEGATDNGRRTQDIVSPIHKRLPTGLQFL